MSDGVGERVATHPHVTTRFVPYLIAAPGTRMGPCEDGCEHKRCIGMRRAAAEFCAGCKNPINYDEPYLVDVQSDTVAHENCLIATQSGVRGAA